VIEKPADTEQAISNIIAERWSGRAFNPEASINQEVIISLCEAARWAPSCYGDQPWRFIVLNRYENEQLWQQAVACLSPSNREWAQNAPLLILSASVAQFTTDGSDNRWTGYDTGAAAISLCLQATGLGLMTHQMGGFDSNELRAAFSLPDDLNLWSMIAVGYPAQLDNLSDNLIERELKPRVRRPLSEQFFNGNWNTPLKSGE
jgi:nitroreductase